MCGEAEVKIPLGCWGWGFSRDVAGKVEVWRPFPLVSKGTGPNFQWKKGSRNAEVRVIDLEGG